MQANPDSPLVITDSLLELLSLECIGDGVVESSLGETQHLRGDTDSSLVQDLDGNLERSRRVMGQPI